VSEDESPPIATASVIPSRRRVPAGSALDVTVRFAVDTQIIAVPRNLRVLVSYIDAQGNRIFPDTLTGVQRLSLLGTWRASAGKRACVHYPTCV
jgi:hypothetical protein